MDRQHISRFSTDGLPERQRLSMWRETFSRVVLKTDVTAPKDEPFRAEINMCALPGLSLSWGSTSSQRADRSRGLLVDGDDDVILVVASAGTARAEQIGSEILITQGSAVLVSGADPGVVSCHLPYSHVTLKVPRRELASLVCDLDQAIMRPIRADVEALRMLGIYTSGIRSGFFPAAVELQHLASTHTRDLVALAIGAVSDASEVLRKRGLRAARLKAIRAYIAANIDRPGLSVESASVTLGISPRYIQVLLKGTGTTFSDLVLSQRLARAQQMLMNPNLTYRSISSVALEAGFSDVSYFNRTFRRAYGATPSDIRAQVKAMGIENADT